MTSGRTWILSSPYLRPGSSHQVPSLSETRMSGSQTGLMRSSHPRGSQRRQTGVGICGLPTVLPQGPLSPPSGSPQSSLRTLPCLQAAPGILSSTQLKPCLLYQFPSLSEPRMSGTPPPVSGPQSETGCQEARPLCQVPSLRLAVRKPAPSRSSV